MAKKFVRGVTCVDDIEKFDKTLTNVNDLLSDGQNTYVHTKRGNSELYYNITNAVNEVQSSDNLLTITKENDTISISNSGLATKQELATKENMLSVDYGISKKQSGNTTKLGIEYTGVPDGFDLNNLTNGYVKGYNLTNAPHDNTWYFITTFGDDNYAIQDAKALIAPNKTFRRVRDNGNWLAWREQVTDKSDIDGLLAQKQNTITNNTSIGVSGTSLQQLYTQKQSYNVSGGLLKTHVKSVSSNTSVSTPEEEFNFIAKIDKAVASVNFTLNDHDKTKFENIMSTYGQDNTVRISGFVFTLAGSNLTVSATNNTNQNYVITFSDII